MTLSVQEQNDSTGPAIGTPDADVPTRAGDGVPRRAFGLFGAGVLMGAADAVPGVSGGTVALIVGVYERLVTSISRIDRQFLQLVRRREMRAAAQHIDLNFLVPLGAGVVTGLGLLASVMKYLLETRRVETHAVFCGLILASSLLVARRVTRWNSRAWAGLLLGLLFAAWLIGRADSPLSSTPDTLWYLFFCGVIGISAMILPGISGAAILVILGRYEHVIGVLREFLHLNISVDVITTIAVFCLGCATGLLTFSRFLRWLLANHGSTTLAVLCGFMIGSLRLLWPIRTWPPQDNQQTVVSLALLVVATAIVLVMDLYVRIRRRPVADQTH